MFKPRLSLPLSALALLVACNQVTSALSMGGEEKAAGEPTSASGDAKAPDATAADAPAVAAPTGPATLDELLTLVHDGASSYIVFKSPEGLLALAETVAGTFEQPLIALASATAPDQVSSVSESFALFKHGVADARDALAKAGTDLARGVVLASTSLSGDDTVVTFSASSPEAAKTLLTALKVPEAESAVCQATPARPGYVTCSKDQATLGAYKPADGKTARSRLGAALPAVDLDDLALFGYIADNDIHFGLANPAGAATVHLSAPPDAKNFLAQLNPGPADLLRFAPAGTGFVWMKLDRDELKKQDVPALLSGSLEAFNGEVLFGGSAEPAALQARLGFNDTSVLAPLADLAIGLGGGLIHNKPIPDVRGSKVSFKAENLTFGTDKVKALHLGVTGVPEAKKIGEQLGLSLDAWVYPAEGTLAAVLGVDAKHVTAVKAAADSAATVATLPEALSESLAKGEVGFIAHFPLDGLQAPALLKLLDGALAGAPGYTPDIARTALRVVAPISSTTVWVTEHQNAGVVHFAVQMIGHPGDDEGKAALAAIASDDPVKAFADLAAQYPSSPKLAAYQTRAGQGGPGAVIGGSAPALLLGAVAGAAFWSAASAQAELVAIEEQAAPVEPTPVEEPKVEAPKVEEPKVEEPKAEAPKVEAPKAEEPKAEEPKAEAPKTETPKTEAPKAEEPKAEAPKLDPIPAEPTRPTRVGRQPKPN